MSRDYARAPILDTAGLLLPGFYIPGADADVCV